jgi:hypothetical protein
MADERVGGSFWLSEFVRSDTAVRRGIDNMPPGQALQNIRSVLGPGMQRIREALGVPVLITSGYRSPALNAIVGGARNSQHLDGLAADFIAPQFGTARTVAKYLASRMADIRADQLIAEGNWVHVSFSPTAARGELLTAHFSGGHVTYTRGIG